AWIKYPGQIEERYTESWDDINHKLLNSGNFGLQLKRERFLKNEVEQLKALNMDTLALIEAAFTTIKNKITWNGQYRKYASDNLRDAYKSGAGNTADINLTLVVLLNELGLEAYPVLISTRKNGMIHPSHPSLSSFNYVIALARIGNDNYLMDATEPLSEINLLPTRCLNNQGWLVDENKSGWIDLQNGKLEKSATYNLTLDEDGKFKGAVDYTYTNYGAFEERLKASDNSDTESYLKEKFKDLRGLTITESSVTGIDTLYNDVKTHLDLEISGHLENAGDLYFFEPLFLDRVEENPFKIEDREYPVEFEYPVCEMQSVSITIPDDYIVEELPKPMIVNLDDKSARFIYNINQLGNKIVITSIFSINKVLFLPEQYPYLKQLLDMVVDKHKEQVVLKKI
nr:hypothetical protein [Bacteroidota bacterium]